MSRTLRLLLLWCMLLVIAFEMAWIVSIWRKPMKDVIQSFVYQEEEFEVLQVSAHEEEVMALLSFHEGDMGMARLHKTGLTFVVDELYDNRVVQRTSHMEVLLASTDERHYVVAKKTSPDIAKLALLFVSNEQNREASVGIQLDEFCLLNDCLKQIDVLVDLAWYVFDPVALSSLVVAATDHEGVIVSLLVPGEMLGD